MALSKSDSRASYLSSVCHIQNLSFNIPKKKDKKVNHNYVKATLLARNDLSSTLTRDHHRIQVLRSHLKCLATCQVPKQVTGTHMLILYSWVERGIVRVNPLLPNISMYILHTVLYTLLREDMSNNQELLKLVIISYILLTFMFHSGVIYCLENLDISFSLGSKG